jgi:Fic family protein
METVTVEWNGHQVEATRCDPIAAGVFDLSEATVRRTEQAAAAVAANAAGSGTAVDVAANAAGSGTAVDVAARLLLRSEGLASSAIEGLRAPVAEVAAAETDPAAAGTAAWVADNLAVVTDALADTRPLDAPMLFAWHARLMRHATSIDERHIGAWRDTLGWVGGANPMMAAHVAVPATDIDSCMSDLFEFIARRDIDPVTQAAIAHAQFETIHPFADGNGRLGRVLIGRILAQRIGVAYPPPVSVRFAADIGGYQAGLALYRQGFIDRWVRWFADAVDAAALSTREVLAMVEALRPVPFERLADVRVDAGARRLLGTLGTHPVVSAEMAADFLGSTRGGARNAILTLENSGILTDAGSWPTGPGRPAHWWAATELLALVGG